MDEQNTTTALTPTQTPVERYLEAPAGTAATAVQTWISAGRKLVEDQLEPLDRIAAQNPTLGHQFAVLRSSIVAGFHALLSHVAHETHPGVVAEMVKATEAPVADAVEAVDDLAKGDLTDAAEAGVSAVTSAVADAAEVAADVTAGAPIVSDDDTASVEAAMASAVEAGVEAEVVPPTGLSDASASASGEAAASPTQGSAQASGDTAGDDSAHDPNG